MSVVDGLKATVYALVVLIILRIIQFKNKLSTVFMKNVGKEKDLERRKNNLEETK